ncbi:MAG: fibronectin type III domain-containing protein, partial [Bacteroides sp.]|nr:fibronectin type III domain-containing protein [Bacteroides sp.]
QIHDCISHGLNDATIGGAVMITYVYFLKKIRIRHFLPLLVIYALFSLQLPAASATTVTIAWDANTEPGVEGYIMYYGTTSPDYQYNVDVGNSTSCTISGLEQGQVYYFAATAYNAIGESEFSEEMSYEEVREMFKGKLFT